LNKKKPGIYFKQRKTGGLTINSMVTLTKINEKLVNSILSEYSNFQIRKYFITNILKYFLIKFNGLFLEIFNAEVLFREDCTADEFIDVIVGNRIYMPCLYVF
jgi:ribosome-interacting GTPase 1